MAAKKMTLKELRELHQLTQKKLGELVGVNNITISNYENGRAVPSDRVREKIRELYGVEIITDEKGTSASKPARKPKAAPEPQIIMDDEEWDVPEELDDEEWEMLEEDGEWETLEDDEEEMMNRSVEIIFQRPDGQTVELGDALDELEGVTEVYITITDPNFRWVGGDKSGTAKLW